MRQSTWAPALALVVGCITCARAAGPPGKAEIRGAFQDYAQRFVQADGRVVDRAGGGVTTSEGQSYAMVRAVWADDRETFERARAWTLANLQGEDPAKLPAWRWGQRADATWGILDENPASDADLFIAYSLLLGAEQWKAPELAEQGRALLDKIWETEVITVGEHLVLLPGPWAAGKPVIKVNPSYSLPFAYRVFAQVDAERAWLQLVDDTYWMWGAVVRADGLFPDWAWLDAESGAVVPPPDGVAVQSEYGFEAMRIPWALAADFRWYDEARAKKVLQGMDGLRARWHRDGTIPAVINADGSAGRDYPYLGLYGALVPAWGITAPDDAQRLYDEAILPTRSVSGWGDTDDYYAHNWVWFGLALWSDKTGLGPTPIGKFEGNL